MKLKEGRGTGLPIIHKSLEENGSPPPVFETDENNGYFLCILPVHPLAESILGSQDDLSRNKDILIIFNTLSDIDMHLRSQKKLKRDQVEPKLLKLVNSVYLNVLNYCKQPQSRLAILENLTLYNNSRNFDNYIKPLLEIDWLKQSLPNKPTSKNQQYYTTDLGKKLLKIISTDPNSGIKRTPVASSNITSVGYDIETKILEIEFNHGAVYQYFEVPENLFEELMKSPAI